MKNKSNRMLGAVRSAISGLIINYTCEDPLEDDSKDKGITPLPYGHKNSILRLKAGRIFKDNKAFIFNNQLMWQITVTPVNISGDNMKEPVEFIARCKVDDITGAVHDYIEQVYSEIDVDFLKHFNFSCMVKK